MPELWEDLVLAQEVNIHNSRSTPLYVYGLILLFLLTVIIGHSFFWHATLIDWDEGVFALQGQWISSAGQFGKPYNFQTPPLYQLIIAVLFILFRTHAFLLPLISLVSACGTLYILYRLSALVIKKEYALYAFLLLATTELFVFFSRSGLSDVFFLFFFLGALYFFVKGTTSNSTRDFAVTGLLTTCALYTKYSAFPLLIILTIMGCVFRKKITKQWFLFSIILPVALFLPYCILFLVLVKAPIISLRHGSLFGFNHLKYFHYCLIFAPVVFVLGLLEVIIRVSRRLSLWPTALVLTIYFIFVGFYHPYMRLVLPLIPFLAILASSFITRLAQFKFLALAIAVILNVVLSFNTIAYSSRTPQTIADHALHAQQTAGAHFIYTNAPPNVYFFINQHIAIPENQAWFSLGKKFPIVLHNKTIMHAGANALASGDTIIVVHASFLPSVSDGQSRILKNAQLVWQGLFIDAPLYLKDPYNPLRDIDQQYTIYKILLTDTTQAQQIWNLGFSKHYTVFVDR